MFIVFDLDDTLANTDHRQPLLDQDFESEEEKWNTFFDACHKDEPVVPLIALIRSLSYVHKTEIWTGRSDRVRKKTEDWLNENIGSNYVATYLTLRMRPEGDFRSDTEIKGEWIAKYGKPDLVFDDRNKMVDWWRAQGVVCCQVKESDF